MLLRFLTSRFISLPYDGQALPHTQAFIRFMMTKTMDSSGKCWHCGDTFSFRIGKGWTRSTSVVERKPRPKPGTLAQLDVASGTAFFPDADRKLPAVYFLYAEGKKARSFPEKHFVSGDGFKRSFWNLERVLQANPDEVFIVEGARRLRPGRGRYTGHAGARRSRSEGQADGGRSDRAARLRLRGRRAEGWAGARHEIHPVRRR
jgi:hypothetical protein